MKPGLFHITLSMLRIEDGPDGVFEAKRLMKNIKNDVEHILQTLDDREMNMKVAGLDTFGQRVLYARVAPSEDSAFWQIVSVIRAT